MRGFRRFLYLASLTIPTLVYSRSLVYIVCLKQLEFLLVEGIVSHHLINLIILPIGIKHSRIPVLRPPCEPCAEHSKHQCGYREGALLVIPLVEDEQGLQDGGGDNQQVH